MLVQGLLGGLLAVVLIALGMELIAHITISLPANLGGENPANFANGGFRAASSVVRLPVTTKIWDWLIPPFLAAVACAIFGWLWSGRAKDTSLWAAIKSP